MTIIHISREAELRHVFGDNWGDARAEPGYYTPRPGVWIGPFPDERSLADWCAANPESMHDEWRRNHPDAPWIIIKPEEY